MTKRSKRETEIPNPALQPLSGLVGTWTTVGTHPYVPNTIFHGKASFEWIEGGAFLIWHSEIDEPEIPSGVAIFGSDDTTKEFFLLYYDERGVSRMYDVSIQDNVWKWWRDTPDFSQRCICTITDNGNTIISQGELSRDGGTTWEKDLELTYTRVT